MEVEERVSLLLGLGGGLSLGGQVLDGLSSSDLGHSTGLSLSSCLALSGDTGIGKTLHDGQLSGGSGTSGHDCLNVLVDLGRQFLMTVRSDIGVSLRFQRKLGYYLSYGRAG